MHSIKRWLTTCCALAALLCAGSRALAVVIYQGGDSQNVVWEGEDVASISNADPTPWEIRADPTASGGRALYLNLTGATQQTAFPVSFAYYQIRFTSPGTYNLYVRWRADKARSDQDANGANSYKVPIGFGDLATDPASLNYGTSSANNTRVPPDANNYFSIKESQTFEVTQADIDAGGQLVLKIGSREWGMFLDRFVLSQNAALTDSDFNGLGNSETSQVVQGNTDDFVAWEGERVSELRNADPTPFEVRTDAAASGGSALYLKLTGATQQTGYPVSFALYALQFKSPGTYNLYVRWRADKARSDQDANGANSYKVPVSFGDLPTDTTSLNYGTSSANNTRVPPDANNYFSIKESQTFEVTQADIDAGGRLTLKIGSREWGMYLDRFVLSQNAALTDADFTALPNSGSVARPVLSKAIGSASRDTIRVTFDRAVKPASVDPAKFKLSGGVAVTGAAVDASSPTDVVVTTATQAAGTLYTLTVSGVTDVGDHPIVPNSTVKFTAWRLAEGWVKKEIYFGTGTTVAELTSNPKYPDHPDSSEFVRSAGMVNDPYADNYGGRFTTFFVPSQAAAYEFYIVGDDNASLYLSSDETEANLQAVLDADPTLTAFDPAVVYTSGQLVAGKRYLLQLLFQEGTGDSRAAVGVRRVGQAIDIPSIPWLGGPATTTYVNPDAGAITFKHHPANATVAAGTRATFSVDAVSPSGGHLFYQWQLNGNDIVGAVRPTYVTPLLLAADAGNAYRVVVSANGSSNTSNAGTVAVGAAVVATEAPYIGINFVGGGNGSPGASLSVYDVAGVVPQDHYNNLEGGVFAAVPLRDAAGAATPVTFTVDTGSTVSTGTGESSADRALLQGYLHNANAVLVLKFAGVPADNYNLVIYSVGFDFQTTYEQSLLLEGGGTYPVISEKAEHAGNYAANPTWVEMKSTDPAARDTGNYTVFRNVHPAADGSLVLTVTPESSTTGITFLPAVNGIQLVRELPVPPQLSLARADTKITLGWTGLASGYRLESSAKVGAGADWTAVAGVANPIAGAGSTVITVGTGNVYYRLTK